MTLVLETSAGVLPQSDEAINQSLQHFGLNAIGEPVVFGDHSFHYYTVENIAMPDQLIEDLMKHSGIKAAYFKPEGTPPSM